MKSREKALEREEDPWSTRSVAADLSIIVVWRISRGTWKNNEYSCEGTHSYATGGTLK